jgi:tetratricopeptide (TPR) repeat protein
VRGELDALAACALARDPARRYGSAAALAEDLRRYLVHEPLQALPRDPLYRARKFLRRHWVGASFAAALVLALVLGLAGTLLGLADARAAWRAAEERRVEAERRRAAEQAEREEADFLVRAFKEALLLAQAREGTGAELSVAELLAVLGDHVEAIGWRSPAAEASLRAALGRCFLAIGADERARQEFLRAHAVGGAALDEDPLDRFDVLEGLIESTRRVGDLAGARVYVAQAVATARAVFAGREPRFHAGLETLLDLASGASGAVDEGALTALEVVLATLPDAIVRGDESGVTARILIEAAAQLQKRGSPSAAPFLDALERRARELLAPEDVRRVTFAWSLVHIRLQPGRAVDEESVRAARELVRMAEERLPRGHWLRSDARRLAGEALLQRGALAEAEGELLLAIAEATQAPPGSITHRMNMALASLGELARALDERPGAELGTALERSWARRCESSGESLWWPVLLRDPRPRVLEAAVAVLRARVEPDARLQLGMLLARAGRTEEALAELGPTRPSADEPLLALALRALALARAGRLPEARAELARLAERRRASPRDPPGLADLLADLRGLLGL